MPLQYKVLWSIPNAGPSVTVLHFRDQGAPNAATIPPYIRAFFAEIASRLPNDVTISFDTEVTLIDTATGQLTSAFPVESPAPVAGTHSGTWAAGAGYRLVWSTQSIRNGRRVRGSTFLVPMSGAQFDAGGKPSAAGQAAVNSAAQTMLTGLGLLSTDLVVYSRPKPGMPGEQHVVGAGSVSDVAGTLRGRKY